MNIITPSTLSVGTFPCPNCRELINAESDQCSYCSARIEPGVADAATSLQEMTMKAVDHGSSIGHLSTVMSILYGLSFAIYFYFGPFLWQTKQFRGIVSLLFFCIGTAIFIVSAFSLPTWYFRYGKLASLDGDYKRAKRKWLIASVTWLSIAVIFIVFAIVFRALGFQIRFST